jgi:hypothetical protein
MDIYDVKEMFSRYYVDPEIARKHVPEKWEIKTHDNGKALLLVMVQECGRMVLDHIFNVGSVGMSHIWIELDGPHEVLDPLPGTSRTLPTWYWYILPHQLEKPLAHIMFQLAGVASQKVQKVDLGGEPSEYRYGEVVEESSGSGYTWEEKSSLYSMPDVVTGSHRFYRKYGVRESWAHAKCFTHFLGYSEVKLTVSDDSMIAGLGFDRSLSGFSNPVWVKHCRVQYKVAYF